MSPILVAAVFIALSLSWGLSNRGRGWGPIGIVPKWETLLASVCGRDSMALWHGITVILAAIALGLPLWWQMTAIAVTTAVFWRLAVTPGWGEYQDGKISANNEAHWIDDFVKTIVAKLPIRFMSAHWVDGISMGFRGAYYLPVFLAAGLITHSWWFAIPAAFFWQAGAVYGAMWHFKVKGDYVFWAEWIDDTIRGGLFFLAFWLTYVA